MNKFAPGNLALPVARWFFKKYTEDKIMGYYTIFDYEINNAKVNKRKAKKLEKFFASNNEGIHGFRNVKLEYNEKGKLEKIKILDYNANFYDDEIFAKKLAEVLTKGEVKIYFTGEDGQKWCYMITPNSAKEMMAVWVSEDELPYVTQFLNSIRNK
jgi:hypothetical protein